MDVDSSGAVDSSDASLDETLNQQRIKRSSRVRSIWWSGIASIVSVILVLVALTLGYNVLGASSASGSVTIGLQLAPTNLDIRNTSGTALDQLLIGNIYESLLTRTTDNTVSAGIAQSWDVSDDRLTYTFHLAENVTFSNGDALDAHDVVWSINTMMKEELQGSTQIEGFESVEAPDAHTVVLKLVAPYSQLLWNLSGRAGIVLDKDARYDAKTQAVGSGPYELSKYEPGFYATLSARDNYWGTHKAQTKTVTVRYYPEPQAALNALTSGDAQVIAPISSTLSKAIEHDSRFIVRAGEDTDKYVLAFNNASGPLTNKSIRQAIRYAIDNEAIIASRGGTDAALGGPIPSLDPGYEDLTHVYPTDISKARSLMREQGYTQEKPLSLSLTYANTYPAEIGQQLVSQLAKIGIRLTVHRVEFATWLSTVYKNRDFDISLVDHNESHDFFQWANPQYYYGYDNKRVQSLYSQAMQASTDKQRDELLAQAARIVSEDAPADWLFNYRVMTTWDRNVTGFPVNLNQTWMPLWEVRVR
ncbi:ABC transporter substrate-binding protein [Alloscardovia theropitheci]|uniref:ABC transporter substrate-binding protein n=2 Tax=Alloscardovia theropitheci TaxID=2496842 RepID=A0A4R0QZ45_9BIFI|nr:ABC transporter substrate-binding protein [Alloscardovia theropitheci]